MQTQIKKLDNLLWVNITEPEILEVRKILENNSMNENLAEEIMDPTLRAKVDTLRNAIYLTLPFPIKRGEVTELEKVNFLIKSNLIISTGNKEISAIKDFVENLEKVVINLKHGNQNHGGVYFVHFLKHIYKNLEDSLVKINDDINSIEQNIFSGDERKNIESIAIVSKKIFDFNSALKLHSEILKIYGESATKIFGIEYFVYVDIINENYLKITNIIENQKEKLQDFKTTTNLLVANNTKQAVKVFTVISVLILPVTFFASFFSMNTKFPNDLVSNSFGTVYIMCFMFGFSVLILLYLHFKKII
jgi:magnesium transporter